MPYHMPHAYRKALYKGAVWACEFGCLVVKMRKVYCTIAKG